MAAESSDRDSSKDSEVGGASARDAEKSSTVGTGDTADRTGTDGTGTGRTGTDAATDSTETTGTGTAAGLRRAEPDADAESTGTKVAAIGSSDTNAGTGSADTAATGSTEADATAAGNRDADAAKPRSGADESEAEESAAAASTDAVARQYPPALIATAVALPVVLIVGLLVAAVLARRAPVEREPLVLGPVAAPAADGQACVTLLPALPTTVGDFTKSTLVEPSPPGTRAWQRPDGGDAIVLRCGLDRPLEFNRASPLQLVNNVQWFEARDPAAKASTWFAVDRETYIALTVPDGSGPTPLQSVSDAITANLPAKALDPGPLPN
ncbi:DUF3515 domain-containing protein [Nocardia brasiliensis]|uniref:DUF3515 domain-containing protein n=1 Tax=Nocardia brasiliensis TaxID=37326 RepID=UPI0009DDE431|nr:DUF3515 domain-containing protein [Nocardia brasiliensis]